MERIKNGTATKDKEAGAGSKEGSGMQGTYDGEISHQVILPSRPLLVRMWESAGYISRWTWGGLLFFVRWAF